SKLGTSTVCGTEDWGRGAEDELYDSVCKSSCALAANTRDPDHFAVSVKAETARGHCSEPFTLETSAGRFACADSIPNIALEFIFVFAVIRSRINHCDFVAAISSGQRNEPKIHPGPGHFGEHESNG